jgi:hypothetical protein
VDQAPPRRAGPLRILVRLFLGLAAAALGVLAWDVWQLRTLRPPLDNTFEGFVRAGRNGGLKLDAAGRRIYWVAPAPRTVVKYTEPPVYEFAPSGELLNWDPGNGEGMMNRTAVRPRGAPATLDEARAWMRGR